MKKASDFNAEFPALTPEQVKWIDTKEVLSTYNVTQRTLRYWRSKDMVGFSKLGKKIFYIERDIEELTKKRDQPKKRVRVRDSKNTSGNKDGFHPITNGLLLTIVFTLPFAGNLIHMKPVAPTAILTPLIVMLLIAGAYGLVQLYKKVRREE